MNASAIVLAGGRSSRMGADKAQLDFGGVPILRRIVEELHRTFADVIVVAAPMSTRNVDLTGVKVIHDEVEFAGPLNALRRGLVASDHEIAFACSCDLPLLNADLAAALCAMIENREAVVPLIDGRDQMLCAAYRKRIAAQIAKLAASGQTRMRALLEVLDVQRVDESGLRAIDPELSSFINVNTPEEYARALSLFEARKRA